MNAVAGQNGCKIHAMGPALETLCGLVATGDCAGRVTCRRCRRALAAQAAGRKVTYRARHRAVVTA